MPGIERLAHPGGDRGRVVGATAAQGVVAGRDAAGVPASAECQAVGQHEPGRGVRWHACRRHNRGLAWQCAWARGWPYSSGFGSVWRWKSRSGSPWLWWWLSAYRSRLGSVPEVPMVSADRWPLPTPSAWPRGRWRSAKRATVAWLQPASKAITATNAAATSAQSPASTAGQAPFPLRGYELLIMLKGIHPQSGDWASVMVAPPQRRLAAERSPKPAHAAVCRRPDACLEFIRRQRLYLAKDHYPRMVVHGIALIRAA